MNEQASNQPIAEAVIPVKADLSEFQRQVDDALDLLSRRLGEAAEAAAKGFKDKMIAALDDVSQRLDPLIEKAGTLGTAPTQQPQGGGGNDKNEESDLSVNVRQLTEKVSDCDTTLRKIDGTVTLISSRVGNIR